MCGTPVMPNEDKDSNKEYECVSYGCPAGGLNEDECAHEHYIMATYQDSNDLNQ
jgi:hypothetical protein